MNNMTTWEEFRKELNITPEDEIQIAFEKELIETMIKIREEQGLTQAQLAEKCDMKQSMIARFEKLTHSPRIHTMLDILTQLGYTLKIVPIENKGQR
jgi:predicted transcriptional regulator